MGAAGSALAQAWPSTPKWTAKAIPDLNGKVTIVTGGYAGIGKENVKELLIHGAKVYIMGRSAEKAAAAIRELKQATGKEALFIKLDLADLKAIKAAAAEFQSKEQHLHILFNNGGVMTPPVDEITSNGYDLQFGTNVLGHFYFTMLLLPTLIATGKASPDGHARVINTSSSAAYLTKGLDFNAIKDGPRRKKLGTQMLYNISKYGNVVFSNELARRYGSEGIVSVSLNPGNIHSELQRHMSGVQLYIVKRLLYPTPMGAISQLWAGTAAGADTVQGKFIVPWAKVGKFPPGSQDPKLGEELWAWLEEQVKDV